jgi:telomere length regulation protein
MTVLESLLLAFLAIIEVNEDKHRLATEHSRQLLETQDWARLIFENAHGGDEESARLKMLGAGVLTKLKEVADRYQALLLGSA